MWTMFKRFNLNSPRMEKKVRKNILKRYYEYIFLMYFIIYYIDMLRINWKYIENIGKKVKRHQLRGVMLHEAVLLVCKARVELVGDSQRCKVAVRFFYCECSSGYLVLASGADIVEVYVLASEKRSCRVRKWRKPFSGNKNSFTIQRQRPSFWHRWHIYIFLRIKFSSNMKKTITGKLKSVF